jgi:hypothetical protein
LNVSGDVLQFDVVAPGVPVVAGVDFSAGARTVGCGQATFNNQQSISNQHSAFSNSYTSPWSPTLFRRVVASSVAAAFCAASRDAYGPARTR